MNVLHVVPWFHPAHVYGGPVYSTYQLCLALAKRGLAIRVLTTNANGRRAHLEVETRRDVELAPNLRARYCPRVASDSVSLEMLRLLPGAVRWADVVHLSAVYSFPTWPSLLACRLEEKPMVWSPRGALQDWRRHSKPLAKAFWRRVCKAVAPGRLALHVTSQRELEGSSVTRLGVPAFVIPNAVHPYPSGPMPPQEDSLRLLYLGRLHPTKGLEALFQACALVGKEHANRWCLSVAGEGQQGYVESLHALVARLEIGRNVVFVGDVRGPAKTELLLSNHVVVVPSHIESFGMVVAEALAHGRPVIASRGTPWSDVERMGCGLFVENTPEALANAILRFRGMPMAEMGERGRLWMRESFDWSKVAASMEALYRTVRGAP